MNYGRESVKKMNEKLEKELKIDLPKRKKKKSFFSILFLMLKRLIKSILVTLSIIIILVCILFGLIYFKYYPTIHEYHTEAIEVIKSSNEDTFVKNLSSYIYDDSGKLISKLSIDSNSDYLKYEDIPENVVNAFVAIEDRTFWEHSGFDINGIIRVCYRYVITKGEEKHGASTITQQLVRSTFLTNEVSIQRKIKEIIYAIELEKKYSKEQIMEFYVNGAYFANRCYGIEAASRKYFDKSTKDLNLSEIAYLCSIPNAPSYYDPLKNKDNALTRRDKILEDMYECGYITISDMNEAKEYEIVLNEPEEEPIQNYETTYAVDCTVRYLMKYNNFEFRYQFEDMNDYRDYLDNYNEAYETYRDELYTNGYRIYTSLNAEKQTLLQTKLDEVMSFNTETGEDGVYELQSASTIIDNQTHKVVAIVGGRSQETNTYTLNRAYQSYRQPGSTFKPLAVYTPALDNGYMPESILQNISVDEAKKVGSKEVPSLTGSSVTLRKAVEKSLNGCSWWLFCKLSPQKGLSYLTNMEFSKIVPDDYYPASSLGGLTYGATTVEMANGYSTLANNGVYHESTCLVSLKNKDGEELYVEAEEKKIYSPGAASEMVDIMKGVIKSGTASSMKWKSDVEAAGKTGTTNESKDGWFCGITPDYSMSVWVGYDNPKMLKSLYGATYPASIWKQVMSELVNGSENKHFVVSTEKDFISYNSSGAEDYYSYLPGREDDEILSNGYTVRNYREDHILADNAEVFMSQLDALNPVDANLESEGNRLYEEASSLVEQIYSRKLYATESEKLAIVYQSFLEKLSGGE